MSQSFVRASVLHLISPLILCLSVVAGVSSPSRAADQSDAPAPAEPSAELPPVIVSATRDEQSLSSTISSATVITAQELRERQITNVGDALRSVVGVDVTQNGAPGGVMNAFIRGANSSQTLVMIDGVPVNNPSVGGFDFADLTTDNIDRIEIVRGPKSSLYGSDANGGVINIVTKRGEGPPRATLSVEGGRYATTREAVSLAGQSGPVDYSAGASYELTRGFSSAAVGTEPDGYQNTTFSSKLGMAVLGDGRVEFTGRYWLGQADLDSYDPNPPYALIDDPGAKQRTQGLVAALSLQKPLTDWWTQRLTASVNQAQYWNKYLLSTPPSVYQNSQFDTRIQRLDWQHDASIGEWVHLTAGVDYSGTMGENSGDPNRHTINNVGFFAQSRLELPMGVSQLSSVRYDVNNRYGDSLTYNIEAAYLFAPTQTRLRGGVGTAFHGPTIQDLYYPDFGNPNLQPETSTSYEIGVEQSLWEKRMVVAVTQFWTNFDNLIQFVDESAQPLPRDCMAPWAPFGVCPVNVAKASSKGQEVTLSIKPINQVLISSNYTHLTAKDLSTAGSPELLRRPRDKAHIGVTVTPIAAVVLTAEVDYVGRRSDSGGTVGSYWLARATGSYAVTKWLQVFGRIENLTDKVYQETLGYGTAGLSLFGGIRVTGP
ncbi:MAG TPA: TonB-dependent receptor [Nitrospiria bacterium]|nr:TonB-dependent receptor [Nitrospiria bacterium]